MKLSAHDLEIEKGRHHNTQRNLRLCKHCSTQNLENEFHFMLVCTKHRCLRTKYLKPYYLHWPSIQKLTNLFSEQSTRTIINISKFIYAANKNRLS